MKVHSHFLQSCNCCCCCWTKHAKLLPSCSPHLYCMFALFCTHHSNNSYYYSSTWNSSENVCRATGDLWFHCAVLKSEHEKANQKKVEHCSSHTGQCVCDTGVYLAFRFTTITCCTCVNGVLLCFFQFVFHSGMILRIETYKENTPSVYRRVCPAVPIPTGTVPSKMKIPNKLGTRVDRLLGSVQAEVCTSFTCTLSNNLRTLYKLRPQKLHWNCPLHFQTQTNSFREMPRTLKKKIK